VKTGVCHCSNPLPNGSRSQVRQRPSVTRFTNTCGLPQLCETLVSASNKNRLLHGRSIVDANKALRNQRRTSGVATAFTRWRSHCGTHIDAFKLFGYDGKNFKEFSAEVHLGNRAWTKWRSTRR
jgi:hypothetical protein